MDTSHPGTIYIAFGTYAQWEYAPKHVIDALVAAMNRFEDYRVIFSYNGKPIPVKKHVRLVRWAPQADILAHPKTKAFVSHGGLKRYGGCMRDESKADRQNGWSTV